MSTRKSGTERGELVGVTSMVEGAAITTVLLCRDLQGLGNGLDLDKIRLWLQERDESLRVEVVPDLCHAPGEARRAAEAGAGRLVLGLCSRDYAELEMHSQARRARLDPLGIEAVNLGVFCSSVREGSQGGEKAKLMLAAAVARARAYPGSNPDNVKPYLLPLSQKVSRRALFTLPPVQYRVVPSIDAQSCVAEAGCAICVQACPHNALERVGRTIRINKARCDGCGLCVTACPQDAVQLPGSSTGQMEAQIITLLEAGPVDLPERRILFVCKGSVQAMEGAGQDGVMASARWLPVVAPCAGMVPVSCILQCLARGVRVGVVSCGDGCSSGQNGAIRGRIDYCRELLRLLGGSAEWVESLNPEDAPEEEPPPAGRAARKEGLNDETPRPSMFGPRATVSALQELAEECQSPPTLSLEHPHSPFGVVSVQPQLCTGCSLCAGACPTGALKFERAGQEVALIFDAGLCNACGQCVSACPEGETGAIGLTRVTDLSRLAQGQTTLYRDQEARCEGCGAPVAPQGMLDRIALLLGEENADLARRIGRYCLSCKGSLGI